MENPLLEPLELKKEPSDDTSTNLLKVDQQDEFLILNKFQARFQDKVIRINVLPNCVCRLCEKVFLSPEDLEIHRKRLHVKLFPNKIINNGNNTYYCNLCSFKSDVLSFCKVHMKSHSQRYHRNLSVITISNDASYMYQHRYKRFDCKLCKFKCYNQPAMIIHVNKPHLKNKFQQCGLCGEKLDNSVTLDNHKCTHTDEKPYKCTEQDSVSNDLNSTDLSEVMKQEEYLILDDPEIEVKKSLSKQNKLKTKQAKTTPVERTKSACYVILNKIYHCTICPFGTMELTKIKAHFELHNITKVRETTYKVAGKKMSRNLKDYLYEYCDTLYRCKVCEFKSFEHEIIKRHVDTFHINFTSRCELCNKFFVSSSVLKVHHGDLITSQYKCLRCEHTSSEPLTKHIEIHPNMCSECTVKMDDSTTGIIYHCSLCSCKFPTLNSWFKHKFTKCHPREIPRAIPILKDAQYEYKSEEKSFQCKLCDSKRSNHSAMRQHINRVHLKIKHYQCELCGKRFFNSASFKKHMRRHTGEKPYKCTECDYAGYDSIATHMQVHNKIKRYHCKICKYKSARPARLRVHMRTHTGEKPFKCLICDYAATHKVSLVNHMKKEHTNLA